MIYVLSWFAGSDTDLRPGNALGFKAPFAGSALFESCPSRYRGTMDWTQVRELLKLEWHSRILDTASDLPSLWYQPQLDQI